MLKCLVVSGPTRFAALAFKEHILTGMKKAALMGYDAVELALRDPAAVDVAAIKDAAIEYNLRVTAIGTGQAFVEEGLSFTAPDPNLRQQALARVEQHIELAAQLQAKVIIGLIRGRSMPAVAREQVEEWMLSALACCARTAQQAGVTLLLEPINRYETDLINTAAEALAVIAKINYANVEVLLDTFHMNIEEPSLTGAIELTSSRLGHFHVADSNRWAPGYGHLDFPQLIARLRSIGYRGAVSAEILPYPDPDTAALKAIESMRNWGL